MCSAMARRALRACERGLPLRSWLTSARVRSHTYTAKCPERAAAEGTDGRAGQMQTLWRHKTEMVVFGSRDEVGAPEPQIITVHHRTAS